MLLIGILLWALMIAGALPRAGHHWIESRLSIWDARWASLASAVLEAILGVGFFRAALVQVALEDGVSTGGLIRVILGVYLPIEGVARLAGTIATGSSVAALPVLAVWRSVAALADVSARGRGDREAS